MAQKIGEFSFGINFEVNTRQLESALDKIRNIDASKMGFTGLDSKQIQTIKNQALEVQKAMSQAFDPKLNTYTFDKFEAALKDAGLSTKTVTQNFAKLGATGKDAIYAITKQLTTTNVQLKQSHAFLEKMGTTIANTLRWQVATKAIQGMTGAIQQGYYFTKDLDKSLNNIRIVTDKSAASMDKFAVKAAAAAKELGKSTTDYTNASLIYYQQGLGDEEVAKRTETTLKAANVTGQSAAAVSEELTAVWNGFQVSLDETESSIDKLAAVAANSASNLEEISTAMSKVAATANMTGVSIDQLAAQISTIESVTRQSPETIGTALKTIYARMSDLKLGETDEDGVSLGTVSGTLDSMGVHILDATGQLRDMGTVIEEVAEKWQYLGKEQQTALAESLGGKRQYTNLVALFENWNKYNESLKISQESLGTLQKQQNTYMDSIKAAEQRFATAKEQMQMALWDDDTIKDVNNALASITENVTEIINVLGGGKGVIQLVTSFIFVQNVCNDCPNLGLITCNNNELTNQGNTFKAMEESARKIAEEGGLNSKDAARYGSDRIKVQRAYVNGQIDDKQRDNYLELLDREIQAQSEYNHLNEQYKNILIDVNSAVKDKKILQDKDLDNTSKANSLIHEQIRALQDEKAVYENLKDEIKDGNFLSKQDIQKVSNKINIKDVASLDENYEETRKKNIELTQQEIIEKRKVYAEERQQIRDNFKERELQLRKESFIEIDKIKEEAALRKKAEENIAEATQQRLKEEIAKVEEIAELKKDAIEKEYLVKEALSKEELATRKQALLDEEKMYTSRIDRQIVSLQSQSSNLNSRAAEAFVAGDTEAFERYKKAIEEVEQKIDNLKKTKTQYRQETQQEMAEYEKGNTAYINSLKDLQKREKLSVAARANVEKKGLEERAKNFKESSEKTQKLEEEYDNQRIRGIINRTQQEVEKEREARNLKIAESDKARSAELTGLTELLKKYEEGGITLEAFKKKIEELTIAEKKLTDAEINLNATPSRVTPKMNAEQLEEQRKLAMEKFNSKLSSGLNAVGQIGSMTMQISSLTESLSHLGEEGTSVFSVLGSAILTTTMAVSSLINVIKALEITLKASTIGIIIGVAITAITILAMLKAAQREEEEARKKSIEAAQKEAESAQKVIDAKKAEKEAVDNLVNSYKDLAQQYEDKEITLSELRNKTYELLKSYGDEALAVKALTSDYYELNDLMKQAQIDKNNEYLETYEKQKDKATSNIRNVEYNAIYKKQIGEDNIDVSKYYLKDDKGKLVSSSESYEALKELQRKGIDLISTSKKGYEFFDIEKLQNYSEDELIKHKDDIYEMLNGLTGKWLPNRVKELLEPVMEDIEKLEDDKSVAQSAQLENVILDTDFSKSVNSIYDTIVDTVKEAYPELDEKELQAKVESIFHEQGKDTNYQRYMISTASQAFKDAYDDIGGSLASDEDVARLYNLFRESDGELVKSVIDLSMKAMTVDPTSLVNDIAAEYADKGEFSEESLTNIYNNDNFKQWLEEDAKLKIEELQNMGAAVRDSYINDYLYSFSGEDNEKIIKEAEESLEEINKDLSYWENVKQHSQSDADRKRAQSNIDALTDSYKKQEQILEQYKNSQKDVSTILKDQRKEFEKYSSELDKTQSAYSTMSDVISTYNENGYITLDQMQSLMTMDAEYLQYLYNENGQLELNAEGMERLARAQLEEMRASILQQGELMAQEIIEGNVSDETLELLENTALMHAEMSDAGSFDEAAAHIHNYIQELVDANNVTDALKLERLQKVQEYTQNRLRTVEYVDKENLLTSGIADNTAKAADSLEDELDIYHDINVELGKIEKAYSRLEKQREKLVGQELYNSYQEELDLLTAQNDALERKQKLQMEEAERMRNELSAVGVAFDANGEVANYNQVLTSWGDQVRANPEDETLKENYDKMKSLLQEYETLWDETIPEVADQIVENSTKQIEAQINKFNFKINLKVTLKDFDREWNDFQKEYLNKVQESDYVKQIESIIKNMQLSYDALGDTTDHLSEINKEVEKLKNGAISDIYGDNKALALEDLQTYLKNLEDLIKEVTEDLVNANEQYKASVDALAEGFEKQISNLERLNNNYENQIKLAQLMLGEGGAAEKVTKLYEKQSAILQDQAQRLTAEGKYWENEINDIQNKLNSDDLTAESRNNLETMLEEATERMIAANEKAGAAYVSSIEAAQNAMLQNAQAQVNKLSEKVFGTQINAFKLAWEAAKEESEDTLDNIERAYETSQLNAKYTKLINDADLATKQKILNAQREMNERLEEQTELTKDDFEYENKKYELLVAEQQLEDARLNKNTLRLSRDSQGNYTYQYIADAAGVSEAEDKVAQLEYELYELSKSQYYDGINQLLDRFENLPQKIQELGIALEQLTNSGASEDEIATLQGVYDTYVKQLENSTKKVNKSAVRGEETTVNALLKIAQSDNARLLIGGVDYEANRVELEKLANSDILSMYQMMIDDKSLAQNLYDNRYKLEQAGLRDWIELEVLDANFFNWSDMNKRIQVNNGEVVLVLEEQEQNFADACKELQENIREYNNKTNELILENEAKAVDAYNEVEGAIGDVITKTDTLVTSLTEEADAAKEAWSNIETLAQKYSTLAHNAGVAAEQAAELYKQLQLANEEAAKTPEDYGVKPGDSDGSLPGGNDNAEKNKEEINTSIKDKIAGGDTYAGLYQAANATANRQLGINVNTNDTQTNAKSMSYLDYYKKSKEYKEHYSASTTDWYKPIAKSEYYDVVDFSELNSKQLIGAEVMKKLAANNVRQYTYTLKPNLAYNDAQKGKWYVWVTPNGESVGSNATRGFTFTEDALNELFYRKTSNKDYSLKKDFDKMLKYSKEKGSYYNTIQFNTGGYTGEWLRGDRDGKLAFLHQKELVLNAEDTKNLLDTVRINREMMQMQLAAAATQSQTPAAFTSNKALDQNVHIEANFPNVTNHTEVETALMNLVNYASQQVSIV